YARLQEVSANREMQKFEANQEKKKSSLVKQLNEGYITNEQYNQQIRKMEAETAYKKADIAYKQAKIQKAVQMASAVSNTALGVVGALTMMPWTYANIVMAGIVGAMGAVQVATIA